ncbi:MAG: fused MFS/spermidine synthase [Atopobiaceae bacterium]|jgi:spermidine synthase|nr:fused MFS/spermidine synthase [Atopobiaceae bacterium]MCH4180673.1 fused MFS/spermidine synthase [Atopobiaceae bacterium]MCH4214690.1 fused MFS/spermidine synthase [Atopobiaceae bacterium]MCH4229904.1 fused MFS/spermidine synthase [Atopobiaceae bacterium]MCH4276736.1 fused MFS/spermidine synthase [Atopobiaceae bacterium]
MARRPPRPHVTETTDDVGRPIRVLEVSGTYQSATYLYDAWADLVFPYHELFDRPLASLPADAHVLMLGGGGYAWPKHLLTTYPRVSIDVVEVDPRVTELARHHLYLDRLEGLCAREGLGRLRIVEDDALRYLESCDATYDLVVDDAFWGARPVSELLGPDGLGAARACMRAGGCYEANVVSALEGRESAPLHDATVALGTCLSHVWVLPCGADEPEVADNNVVVASDVELLLGDAVRLS